MLRYGILPAQPPFPSCTYFPFQSVAGSQTANLISESLDGRMTPLTSQCAGTVIVGVFAAPPGPSVAEKGPAGIIAAEVIDVRDSFKSFKLSHDCCAKTV